MPLQKPKSVRKSKPRHTKQAPKSAAIKPTKKRTQHKTPGSLRALMMHPPHASRVFLADPAKRTTLVLKNCQLKCVKPNSVLHVVESRCGENSKGHHFVKLLGVVKFLGNEQVHQSEIFSPSMKARHQMTRPQITTLQAGWTRKIDGAIGWRIEMAEHFKPPLFVAAGSEAGTIYESILWPIIVLMVSKL
jgi:hypothetical protein